MTILVAKEFTAGRFEKRATFNLKPDGHGPVSAKWQGSVESFHARNAARFFASEPSAREVFLAGGYRLTLVS